MIDSGTVYGKIKIRNWSDSDGSGGISLYQEGGAISVSHEQTRALALAIDPDIARDAADDAARLANALRACVLLIPADDDLLKRVMDALQKHGDQVEGKPRTYEIGILNECDQPMASMLVIRWKRDDVWRWSYISTQRSKGDHIMREEDAFTPLSSFGMRAFLGTLGGDEGGVLRVSKFGPSIATYRDGAGRQWQGDNHPSSIMVHPHMIPLIRKALASQLVAQGGAE